MYVYICIYVFIVVTTAIGKNKTFLFVPGMLKTYSKQAYKHTS